MYPSPRQIVYPPLSETVAASPKKKPRPNVLRQLYALPAIHRFEPVRTSQALSPRAVLSREEITTSPPNSPQRPRGGQEDKLSPRLRPQPPPPTATTAAAATASRTDQDLFRYSQGVKQRMMIRPLFEQRREEEADIARRILVSRETEAGHSRQGSRGGCDRDDEVDREHEEREQLSRSPLSAVGGFSGPRRATTPITATEIAELRSSSSSFPAPPRTSETPRAKRVRKNQSESRETTTDPASDAVQSFGDTHQAEEKDEVALTSVRFRTPTPPSSAGPNRSHFAQTPTNESSPAANVVVDPTAAADDLTALSYEPAALREHDALSPPANTKGSLVSNLSESTLHTPFLQKRGSKMIWLTRKPSIMDAPETKSTEKPARSQTTLSATICYKLLWKDARAFTRQNGDVDNVELRVLLGSNGRAHISIQAITSPPTDEQKLAISDSDLVLSAKTRPDLAVMTPKWARWLLTRLERDAHGVWFLRIQDIFAMGEACVFMGDVTFKAIGSSTCAESLEGDHTLSVSIYLLGAEGTDSEVLLVHARAPAAVVPSLTEVVLKRHELMEIAASQGPLTPPAIGEVDAQLESTVSVDDQMRALLRDPDFLQRAVAESKIVRLALRSGLHIAEATDSASDLPFRTGSRAATSGASADDGSFHLMTSEPSKDSRRSHTITEYEVQGLTYATPEVEMLLRSNEQLAEVAFLSQAYWEDAAESALRWLQRKQAVDLYVASYVHEDGSDPTEMSNAVRRRIEAAKLAKLEDIAVRSIVEDMIADFIALECRFELHHAKYSGGYDDFYASKLQSAYRMSYQRRDYITKRNTRQRAVRLIQALQRGIIARRRYCEMRVEREKYLFYGFRSSLHHSTASVEDPHHRAMDISHETERRRQTFLMQVLHGYVAQHGIPTPFRISPELVQSIVNEYSVVVGCSPTLGDAVAAILITSRHSQPLPKKAEAKAPPPRLFGSGEIHAALVTALRMQYDDTYGLSSRIRRLAASEKSPTKAQMLVSSKRLSSVQSSVDENIPPRWLLKVSPPFQRANRNRLASLRLTRKAVGRRAAHLVALDYRNLLRHSFQSVDKCRAIWEDSIRSRKQQTLLYDGFSVDDLVQYALDKLTIAVKDWGLDPEPLFEGLNLCLLHRLGKEAIALTEQAFDRFARGVNELHGKRNVYPLRDEIAQELEEFEALLALRCLNIANDGVVTVPPSELLHVLLVGKVDVEYLRHGLPSVLPIASIKEKAQLAQKMIRSYASASYGEAFNAICCSCLDTAENVTVEAAQFLERITRRETQDEEHNHREPQNSPAGASDLSSPQPTTSITARALYLLTGSHALRFLQFLAKVAHFNKPLQHRVLDHLAAHAQDLELYRFASVVCSIDSFEVVTRLFDESFNAAAVHAATRFWVQYGALYGEERAETARASLAPAETEITKDEPELAAQPEPIPA